MNPSYIIGISDVTRSQPRYNFIVQTLQIVALVLASPPDAAASSAAPSAVEPAPAHSLPQEAGLLLSGNYVLLSPGSIGVTAVPDVAFVSFVWGIDAGHYFTAGKRFAAALGGFFEHMVVAYLPATGDRSTTTFKDLRLGTVLRVGTRYRRLFAYGLGRLGADLTLDYNLEEYDIYTTKVTSKHYKVYPWLMGSVGGGVQGLIGRHFLLGGEAAAEIGGEPFMQFRLRLLLGIRF